MVPIFYHRRPEDCWILLNMLLLMKLLVLYNLAEDPFENNNLAERMPEKLSELQRLLIDWKTEVKAEQPVF
jgi:hypothetical protein